MQTICKTYAKKIFNIPQGLSQAKILLISRFTKSEIGKPSATKDACV